MTGVKENGEADREALDSGAAEMEKDILEEEKEEDRDKVEEKQQMSEEREIKQEDREEEGDEDEVNNQTANEDLQPRQQVGTSNVDKESPKEIHQKEAADNAVNVVEDSKSCDAKVHKEGPAYAKNDDNNEEEEEHKNSDHKSVKMHSNIPAPDKSADTVMEVDEKICGRNEQISVGPHDEQRRDAISEGNDYVKCERGADDSAEVKIEENTKEVTAVVDNMEKIKDVSIAMESTERNQTFMFNDASEGGESGTEEEQSAFMKDVENLYREKSLEFKAPKFYGEPLNLLKLWRAVIKLGGYDKVTACKLWRQVGESFNPPKTCTTVSWTFRIFYEKALLEYERHKISGGELDIPATVTEPVSMESPAVNSQASGSGRQRRDAAARAMQGWHSQRLLGSGEVSDPIIKDKNPISLKSREKHLKNIGGQKRKKPLVEAAVKASRSKLIKGPSDTAVIDIGPAADWVKINVRTTKDCYEVYALVPGLLREEVRVQSDPAGRLVITGEPEHADNPWGVTPFKKVVSLPSRIDPHQTSAVVTLHGQLFVRVPFEQLD